MSIDGWITFLISMSFFMSLFGWCLYKVLTAKESRDDDMHGAFDIYEIEKNASRDDKKSR